MKRADARLVLYHVSPLIVSRLKQTAVSHRDPPFFSPLAIWNFLEVSSSWYKFKLFADSHWEQGYCVYATGVLALWPCFMASNTYIFPFFKRLCFVITGWLTEVPQCILFPHLAQVSGIWTVTSPTLTSLCVPSPVLPSHPLKFTP